MSVHLQPRDLLLLEEIGEYGLLDTATIHARHWSGAKDPRACQQRLSKLVDGGLIRQTRLTVVVDVGRGGGSLPAAYMLTPRGADFIERETGRRPARVAGNDLAATTILHRLETVHARVALDDACAAAGLPRPAWILEQDSYANVTPADPLEKRQVLYERITLENGGQVSCRPDASSLLQIPKPARPNAFDSLVIYWEIDRNAGHKSSSKREAEKIDGYEALIESGGHVEHWPKAAAAAVRVFYVCPNKERIQSIAQHVRGRPAAKFYRFAVKSDAVAPGILTSPVWCDAEGQNFSIWRRPA